MTKFQDVAVSFGEAVSLEQMFPTEELALVEILEHHGPADTTLIRQHEHWGSNQFRLAEFSVTVIILMMDRDFYLGGRGHQLPVSTD